MLTLIMKCHDECLLGSQADSEVLEAARWEGARITASRCWWATAPADKWNPHRAGVEGCGTSGKGSRRACGSGVEIWG